MGLEEHLFDEILTLLKVNDLPGKFISIDALDGGGNSTQSELLAGYLKGVRGIPAAATKEPTDQRIGLVIREVLRKEWSLSAIPLQELFSADRGYHLDHLVLPSLTKGSWVVTARYALTSLAWGTAQGIPSWFLLAANVYYPWPNLNIVLMLSVEECLRRIDERNQRRTDQRELFEARASMEANLKALEQMAHRLPNVVLLDGEGSVPEVFARIRQVVEERLLTPIS